MVYIQRSINGHPTGWKKGREQVKDDWKCPSCGAFNRYYWATCPVCSHPRPN